jgi:hypothetical protein
MSILLYAQTEGMSKNFPYAESELLKIASRFNKNLKGHFHDLQGQSVELDRDFVFRFKAAFYESRVRPVDQEVAKLTLKLHQESGNLINAAHNLFHIFKLYIQKAFPHDSRIWDPFGYCEIENATHDYDKLHDCLSEFIKLIHSKRFELLAVNCPDTSFVEIEDLFNKIEEKHNEILQINDMKGVSNESRMISMNKLYKLMQVIHNAATVRFKNDPYTMEKLTFPACDTDNQTLFSASA